MWQGHGGAVHSHDRIDALRAVRGAGGGLGMPPPEKFRSGHLPRAAAPPLRTDDGSVASGSDMEESSDTEEVEVCSGRYSVDSSPRREDILRRTAVPQYRYATVPGMPSYYSSDYSDLSSSRDTALPRTKQQQVRRPQAQVGRYVEEEEYSDSAGSSEFSSQVETRSKGVASRGGYASEYSHNGPARREANNAVPKTRMAAAENYSRTAPLNSRTYQQDKYSAHVPAQDNVKSSQMVRFCAYL